MKRTLILLLASGMLLAGCNCPFAEQPAQNDDEIAGFVGNKLNGDHLTYLVLSKVGRYSGGDVVAKDDTLFLENFIKFTGAPGTDLPGKDAITASSGAEFVSWVSYDGTGALTEHDKVPAQSGKILYAYFKGTGGSPTPGPGPTPSGETVTYTITAMPNWIANDGATVFAWSWGGGIADAWVQVVLGPQGNGGADAKELSGTVELPAGRTGFNLARCVAGTTTPDWTAKGNADGRVYNKTGDVTITAGTTSYESPNWVEYNPQ